MVVFGYTAPRKAMRNSTFTLTANTGLSDPLYDGSHVCDCILFKEDIDLLNGTDTHTHTHTHRDTLTTSALCEHVIPAPSGVLMVQDTSTTNTLLTINLLDAISLPRCPGFGHLWTQQTMEYFCCMCLNCTEAVAV